MCITGWSTFTTALRVVSTRLPREMTLFSRPIASTTCLAVWLLLSVSGHLPKEKERYRNTHSTASGETETDADWPHKTRNSSARKGVLTTHGYIPVAKQVPWRIWSSCPHTNNFVQVSQALLDWAEGDKSVCSARMLYLPPLFRLTSLNQETSRGYITTQGYKGIQMDVRNTIYFSKINKMQRYTMVFIIINALHVSSGSSANHQELKTVYTASSICRAFSAS